MNYEINLEGSKVLIVDDNPQNLSLLGTFLKKYNFNLAVALDGQSAFETAIKFDPDLILMDINMPKLNGFESAKLLKSEPKTQNIPIIFTTALADTVNIIKGYEVGGVDYVVKPFKLEELYQRVKAHLQIKKLIDIIGKKNNELEVANLAKDKFFSIISHDLRSPFTATLGMSELILKHSEKFTKEDIIKNIEQIYDSLKLQFNLLEKLLDWSRVQTGTMEFRPQKISINELLKNSINNFVNNIEQKNINFSVLSELDLDNIFLEVDEFMINSSLSNLISNAIKFTNKDGNILLTINKLNEIIEFIFEDDGVGMKSEVVQNLFRLDIHNASVGTEKEKGTGLELILVKEFIEKNNGTISVESTENKGSKFILNFNL